MKTELVEVYSERTNHAIVRPPGRQFPGTVMQGDTLSTLCSEARELSLRLKALKPQDEELLWVAQGIQEQLLERLLHYQKTLIEHGISLPYSVPASQSDQVVLVEVGRSEA